MTAHPSSPFSPFASGTALRERLGSGITLPVAGAYDVFSATIAARHFDAVFLGGDSFSASHYGLPDEGYVTWTDMVDFTDRVRTVLPTTHLVVDIDDGFGDVRQSHNMVQRLERVGASAVVFRDSGGRSPHGEDSDHHVLPIATTIRRLEALLETRHDLFVVARTDASFEDGLVRAGAFAAAGADAVLIDGVRSVEELGRIREQVPASTFLSVNLVPGGRTPFLGSRELEECGVDLAIYSTACLFSAQEAIESVMRRMCEHDGLLEEGTGRIHLPENHGVLCENRDRARLDRRSSAA